MTPKSYFGEPLVQTTPSSDEQRSRYFITFLMLQVPPSSSSSAAGAGGMSCALSKMVRPSAAAGAAVGAGEDVGAGPAVIGFLLGGVAVEQRPSSHVVPAGHWEQASPGSIMEARAKLPAGP